MDFDNQQIIFRVKNVGEKEYKDQVGYLCYIRPIFTNKIYYPFISFQNPRKGDCTFRVCEI